MTKFIAPEALPKDRMLAIFELYTFWPSTVPVPASFEIKQSSWSVPEQGEREGSRPLAVVTLPNGATVKIELIDPFDLDSRYEVYSAGWDSYTGDDVELRNSLSDVLHKVFITLIKETED